MSFIFFSWINWMFWFQINHKLFSTCFLSSFKFFLQLLCISLVLLIFPHILLKSCSKMYFSASRMLASKITYSARNSAGRIYPNLLTPNRNLRGKAHILQATKFNALRLIRCHFTLTVFMTPLVILRFHKLSEGFLCNSQSWSWRMFLLFSTQLATHSTHWGEFLLTINVAWVSGVSGGKGKRSEKGRPKKSPLPLGRPDTQATINVFSLVWLRQGSPRLALGTTGQKFYPSWINKCIIPYMYVCSHVLGKL